MEDPTSAAPTNRSLLHFALTFAVQLVVTNEIKTTTGRVDELIARMIIWDSKFGDAGSYQCTTCTREALFLGDKMVDRQPRFVGFDSLMTCARPLYSRRVDSRRSVDRQPLALARVCSKILMLMNRLRLDAITALQGVR